MSTTDDMNAKFQVVPELAASKYGAYPMELTKWLSPQEKTPEGNPAFIASPKPEKGQTSVLKPDYVWGPGMYGFGYYHLLTKESYKILAARLHNELAPDVGCSCFGGGSSTADTPNRKDLAEVHIVMYYRSKSSVPNDSVARKEGLKADGIAFQPMDNLSILDLKPSKIKLK
jgi:hypothetical protein